MPSPRILSLILVFATASAGLAVATEPTPGFLPGDARPTGDGPAIRVPGGWMVSYDETIPGTDIVFTMVPVPGGSFRMGSPADEAGRNPDEGPVFEVNLAPFWMGRCEVTWDEYKAYMAACDLIRSLQAAKLRVVTEETQADAITAPSMLYEPSFTFGKGEDPLQPAVTMSQFAARQYTGWLSGLTGRFYRLPTEAEWEYACRAGTATPWSSGETSDTLGDVAWFAANADDTTHPVGNKKPNAWGLHDMHGNVSEWVLDELVADGYARQAALSPPVAGQEAIEWPQNLSPRVVRGGAYYDEPEECRSAARRGSEDEDWKASDPNFPLSPWWYTEEPARGVGMRVVRPLEPPEAPDRRRWWDADLESIRDDVEHRLKKGKGARAVIDPKLPDDAKAAGLAN